MVVTPFLNLLPVGCRYFYGDLVFKDVLLQGITYGNGPVVVGVIGQHKFLHFIDLSFSILFVGEVVFEETVQFLLGPVNR